MARPKLKKRICSLPRTSIFVPFGIKKASVCKLTVEEYEVIRLLDLLNYDQEECSYQMQVSRATVQSIYTSARSKIADAIVNGKKLIIDGGDFDICAESETCCGKYCTFAKCDQNCDKGHCCNCRKKYYDENK